MTKQTLEQKLQGHASPFEMLYNAPASPFQFPIKPEFSNFRDEQAAWKNAAIFQDMSHHMTDLQLQGPDVSKLLQSLAINSFSNFGAMKAKQLVVCNYDGFMIGDAILTCETENKVHILGRPSSIMWIAYHAATGGYDVETLCIDKPSPNLADRRLYRYQVQGPNANKILEAVNGGPLPDIPFFKMGKFRIGSYETTALNHRMSGAPGYEFWGSSEEGEAVRELVFEAGEKYDLTPVGGRIYPCTSAESGWFGGAVPAVYTGEKMKEYREWLPAQSPEGSGSIGGSYYSEEHNIEDLYLTPYELGYGFMLKFDHEFIGREALEKMAEQPKRKKVRLVWNAEDTNDVHASQFRPDAERYKYMEMPVANYSTFSCDEVLLDGERVGMSFVPAYSNNLRAWISLACVREELAVDGKELIVTWGERDGGSAKPTVERHVQKAIRVTVDAEPVKRD